MPLGTEVGLGPGDIVLVGDPAPHKQVHSTRHFSAHVYCEETAEWIKRPLSMSDLGPGHIVLDRGPASLSERGTAATYFSPCLLWPNGRPSQLLLGSCSYFSNKRSAAAEIGDRLATIDMGRKVWGCCGPFPWGSWVHI